MPLVISVEVGHYFSVGDHAVLLKSLTTGGAVVSIRGKSLPVSKENWTPVCPGVELRCTLKSKGRGSHATLQINAPGLKVTRNLKEANHETQ